MDNSIEAELRRFPNTGLFLEGRLRSSMTEEERQRLEDMVGSVERHEHGDRLIARGSLCNRSTMLVEGFMIRTLESDGRRYVVSFHVPGDFVDLHCFALKRLDHNIDCIGPCKVALIPHEEIIQTMQEAPHLAHVFWFSTLLDAAMHREWILKLEQLTAPRRIAHFFAEIWRRLTMVGLGYPDGFDTPLRQSDVAEMCGATPIHTNRAISELRQLGIAEFHRGRVTIKDRAALERYAHFSSDYLYGEGDLQMHKGDLSANDRS